jgi:hypothetical protein
MHDCRRSLSFSLRSGPQCPAEQVASMEASNSLPPRPFYPPFNQNNQPLRLLPNQKFLPSVFQRHTQNLYSLPTKRTLRTKMLPQLLAGQRLVHCCQSYLLSIIIETFVPPNPKDGPRPLPLHPSSANLNHQPTSLPMLPHLPRSLRSA